MRDFSNFLKIGLLDSEDEQIYTKYLDNLCQIQGMCKVLL